MNPTLVWRVRLGVVALAVALMAAQTGNPNVPAASPAVLAAAAAPLAPLARADAAAAPTPVAVTTAARAVRSRPTTERSARRITAPVVRAQPPARR